MELIPGAQLLKRSVNKNHMSHLLISILAFEFALVTGYADEAKLRPLTESPDGQYGIADLEG